MAETIHHVQNCLEVKNLKQKKKITHQNNLIFVMALYYAQMKTCLSQIELIQTPRKSNGTMPILCVHNFKALDYLQVPSANTVFSFQILFRH